MKYMGLRALALTLSVLLLKGWMGWSAACLRPRIPWQWSKNEYDPLKMRKKHRKTHVFPKEGAAKQKSGLNVAKRVLQF